MKYRHKDPIFLENRTFTKHLESLQISILPFTCTMRDCKSSFHTTKSEKIAMKNDFYSQTGRTRLGHMSPSMDVGKHPLGFPAWFILGKKGDLVNEESGLLN
jgi:hypothetical protein